MNDLSHSSTGIVERPCRIKFLAFITIVVVTCAETSRVAQRCLDILYNDNTKILVERMSTYSKRDFLVYRRAALAVCGESDRFFAGWIK